MSAVRWFIAAVSILALSGCASIERSVVGETVHRNLTFAVPDGRALKLDLYVPRSAQPAPLVLWIHGGSWKYGGKRLSQKLRALPQAGLAVASIEYRKSGVATYPAQLEDCQAAVRWLRANAARYGVDARRLGLAGVSSGGHLAALLGAVEERPRVSAVCVLCPVTDLVALGRQHSSPLRWNAVEQLLGGRIEQRLALAAAASPIQRVGPGVPPFLIYHGQDDGLVPAQQSVELGRRVRAAGADAEVILLPKTGHLFSLNEAQLAHVVRFFHDHLDSLP